MELMITIALTSVLVGAVMFMFTACFRTWDAADNRSNIRTELSQALEFMAKHLRQAKSIDGIGADAVYLTEDLGEGEIKTRYHLYRASEAVPYQLFRGLNTDPQGVGAVMARNIESAEVFTQTGSLITIDLVEVNNGSRVQMRTSVRPRGL
jgi:type II secretory pathway component PulJ